MRHKKFEANPDPTSDGFENFYDSLWHSAIHDLCHKLSVGIQLLLEQKLGLPQTFHVSLHIFLGVITI